MKKKKLLIPFGIIFLTIVLAVACEQTVEPPPPAEEEPFFKPGEYGGDAIEGTEHLYNFQLSPDGILYTAVPGWFFQAAPKERIHFMC